MNLKEPPCESGILECYINKQLQNIDLEYQFAPLYAQGIKEGLKTRHCDPCYNHFYEKHIINNTYDKDSEE